MKDSTKNTLIWIFIIPLSLLGGFIWTFPLHWILYGTLVNGSISTGLDIVPIEHFLTPLVVVPMMIITGYKLAPKYKFKTSLLLFLFWIITALIVVVVEPSRTVDFRTVCTFIVSSLVLYKLAGKKVTSEVNSLEVIDHKRNNHNETVSKINSSVFYTIMSIIIAILLIVIAYYL